MTEMCPTPGCGPVHADCCCHYGSKHQFRAPRHQHDLAPWADPSVRGDAVGFTLRMKCRGCGKVLDEPVPLMAQVQVQALLDSARIIADGVLSEMGVR